MENYIVRIYARDQEDPGKVTGTLESVEGETLQAFQSLNALPELLNPDTTPRPRQADD
ncbi:MAG: hypothetical protein J5I92_02275 [Thiogranum sp.]|nr:hypothetical protein [Thiogranum sp.]